MSALGAATFAAISGSWRPFLCLVAIAALLGGVEVDRPDHPQKRALSVFSIAVGLFALTIASFYA